MTQWKNHITGYRKASTNYQTCIKYSRIKYKYKYQVQRVYQVFLTKIRKANTTDSTR